MKNYYLKYQLILLFLIPMYSLSQDKIRKRWLHNEWKIINLTNKNSVLNLDIDTLKLYFYDYRNPKKELSSYPIMTIDRFLLGNNTGFKSFGGRKLFGIGFFTQNKTCSYEISGRWKLKRTRKYWRLILKWTVYENIEDANSPHVNYKKEYKIEVLNKDEMVLVLLSSKSKTKT